MWRFGTRNIESWNLGYEKSSNPLASRNQGRTKPNQQLPMRSEVSGMSKTRFIRWRGPSVKEADCLVAPKGSSPRSPCGSHSSTPSSQTTTTAAKLRNILPTSTIHQACLSEQKEFVSAFMTSNGERASFWSYRSLW